MISGRFEVQNQVNLDSNQMVSPRALQGMLKANSLTTRNLVANTQLHKSVPLDSDSTDTRVKNQRKLVFVKLSSSRLPAIQE